MNSVYALLSLNKRITRIVLVIIMPVAVIAAMTAAALLFIPGLVEGFNQVRRLSTYLFVSMIILGSITSCCSLLWILGPVWRETGVAFGLDQSKEPEVEEVAG